MVDYIIVGLGLAGISFCEELEKHNKSFIVFDDASQSSSTVAGGMYNPVILKRFTPVWNAKEQLDLALPFYKNLASKLKVKLVHEIPVYRRFSDIAEQNTWFEALDKPKLEPFMSDQLVKNTNASIKADYGYGQVLSTGRIETKLLLDKYKEYLVSRDGLITSTFNYDAVITTDEGVSYNAIKAKHIVFAEGYGLQKNPFFNYLPLNGTKGELLTIKAPDLKEEHIVKSSVFIIPLGDDLYKIGATYKWKDKTNLPTTLAKEELLQKLRTFLNCDFEVVAHEAGIRPTVSDRKPLIGRHPNHKNVYVFNGMGSRGVMIGPTVAKQLYGFIENNIALPEEIDCNRFAEKSNG